MHFTWINNRIGLGGEPHHEFHCQQLKDVGISHVVDMRLEATEAHALEAEDAGLVRLHFPLHDGNPLYYEKKAVTLEDLERSKPSRFSPSALMIQDAIEATLKILVEFHEAKVYVHCAAGISRSPTVVIGVLVRMGWSLAAATQMVKRQRPTIMPAPWLLETLELIVGSDNNRALI